MARTPWTILAGLLLLDAGGLHAAGSESCSAFNARLGVFHARRAAEYSAAGRRHRDLEAALKAEVDDARALAASLRRQAARSRGRALRQHLMAQARAALEGAAAAAHRLEAAVREHRADEARFKEEYKASARALLAERPRGCAVRGLD